MLIFVIVTLNKLKQNHPLFMKTIFSIFLALVIISCTEKHVEIQKPSEDFCSKIHTTDSVSLSSALAVLQDSMKNKTGVYVLEDGGTAMVARAWLSEHAEKTLDIQYFIFSTDNVGLIACDYLVRAADRGVKVRIIVDDILVDAGPYEILTLDSHENIEIKIYNPGINLGKNIVSKLKKFVTDFNGANQRMHNKTFTVDGKVVITGGRNIADEYFDFDHRYNFRDRDVLLIGKEVSTVKSSFETFWQHPLCIPITQLVTDSSVHATDKSRFERLHQYACNPENFWPQVRERIQKLPTAFTEIQNTGNLIWLDSVKFIADDPGKNLDRADRKGGNTTSALYQLVQQAKSSILIQSPYLITTDEGKKLFNDAIQRGVKIKILTNSLASTDNLEAFSGYQRDRKKLLETGVRIFEFKPDAEERFKIMTGELQQKLDFKPIFGLHAKSMVVDGHITVIGTFNLDPRSANLNSECITVIHSKQIANGVALGMEEEFKNVNSWEVTKTFNPDEAAGKLKRAKALSRRIVPKGIL